MRDVLPMFSCGAEGTYSVVALVPAGGVMDPPEGVPEGAPVMVHATACREHLPGLRRYLQSLSPEPVWTLGTEYLMDHWEQVMTPLDLPVYGYARAV